MKMQWAAGVVVAGVLTATPWVMQAQNGNANRPAPSVTAANSSGSGVASPELMTLTVHEAWLKSGRNEDKFFDMVKQLAEVSAQKRGLTLPDTEAAGRKMGTLIKASARKDPDQSLYSVVDAAVKLTAGVGTSASVNK